LRLINLAITCPEDFHSTSFAKGAKVRALWNKLTTWAKGDRGASMVEYALLVVLIAIIALVAVSLAGQNVSSAFSTIATSLAAAN
jgi:pilus assembly protein Flp/PilA